LNNIYFFAITKFCCGFRARWRFEYRLIRDRSNPMEVPDEKYVEIFRLTKHLAVNVFEEIREFMENVD
jgi:hypothetical protein